MNKTTIFILYTIIIIFLMMAAPPIGIILLMISAFFFYLNSDKNKIDNVRTTRQGRNRRNERTREKERSPNCWNCKGQLHTSTHPTCDTCGWLACICMACGCNYRRTIVIPEWMKGHHYDRLSVPPISDITEMIHCHSCNQMNRVILGKRKYARCGACGNSLRRIVKRFLKPNLWIEGSAYHRKESGYMELKLFIPQHVQTSRDEGRYYHDTIRANEVTLALYELRNNNLTLNGSGELIVLQPYLFHKVMNIKMQRDASYSSIYKFIGSFVDGLLQGAGEEYRSRDKIFELYYKGEFRNNMKNGRGQEYYHGKILYNGEWVDNESSQRSPFHGFS